MGKYKKELLKIANAIGEGDDPFAAWENLHRAITVDDLKAAMHSVGLIPRDDLEDRYERIVDKLNAVSSLVR